MGTVSFENQQTWEQADEAYRGLLRAIEIAERCELCATALVVDGRRPDHPVGPPG